MHLNTNMQFNKYNKIINLNLQSIKLIYLQLYIYDQSYFAKSNIILNLSIVYNLYNGLLNYLLIKNMANFSLLCLNFLSDLTASHHISDFYNFEIINVFRNLYIKNFNYIFTYKLRYNIPIFSISKIFSSSNWLEREIYDMFGLLFLNHFDLRRILNDYGFKGFPMLKDFPVFGYKEIWYNMERQQVMYSNLRLSQSWRFYFFGTQWKKNK